MANQMKDAELRELLKTVESEISTALASEAGRLSKAIPGDKEPDGDEGMPPSDDGGGAAPGGDESVAVPPASEGSAVDPGASSAAPGEAPGEDGGGPGDGSPAEGDDGGPGGEDPAADQGGDMEALKGEYLKLGQEDPEALKAHYLACVEALQSIMGQDQGAGAAPRPPAMKAEVDGATKGRLDAVEPTGKDMGEGSVDGHGRLAAVAVKSEKMKGGNGGPVIKSENAEIASLKKNQDLLILALDKFLGAPLRKAVTGVHTLSGGKQVVVSTRKEAKSILSEKIIAGSLKKSDRERAIAFTVGHLDLEDIKDLLA